MLTSTLKAINGIYYKTLIHIEQFFFTNRLSFLREIESNDLSLSNLENSNVMYILFFWIVRVKISILINKLCCEFYF